MVRLILLIIFILFVIWILQPFLSTRDGNKKKDPVERSLGLAQGDYSKQNTLLIIVTALISLALVFWLLPKFGINIIALLQKIIPIISSLRGILPF